MAKKPKGKAKPKNEAEKARSVMKGRGKGSKSKEDVGIASEKGERKTDGGKGSKPKEDDGIARKKKAGKTSATLGRAPEVGVDGPNALEEAAAMKDITKTDGSDAAEEHVGEEDVDGEEMEEEEIEEEEQTADLDELVRDESTDDRVELGAIAVCTTNRADEPSLGECIYTPSKRESALNVKATALAFAHSAAA